MLSASYLWIIVKDKLFDRITVSIVSRPFFIFYTVYLFMDIDITYGIEADITVKLRHPERTYSNNSFLFNKETFFGFAFYITFKPFLEITNNFF